MKGRHWVFIVGIIATVVMAIVAPEAADDMILLLLFMGIGIALTK